MENMIKRILEIDSKAREMTAKAQATRSEAMASVKGKKDALKKEYSEKMQARIIAFEESERKAAEQKIEENDAASKDILEKLNKMYSNKCDEWTETLFKRSLS